MKVAGSALIGVDRERVWAALQDPAVLVRTIPGCERLEETGPDTYRMTVTAGVASIKGVYHGEVVLAEPVEPERFTLKARGQGAPGTVEATVLVRLTPEGAATRVDYDAEAVVGGPVGGVGQRMLGAVAKRTAGEFFTAVDRHLTATAPSSTAADAHATPTDAHATAADPHLPASDARSAAGDPRLAAAGDLPVAEARPVRLSSPGAVYERPAVPRQEGGGLPVAAAFALGAVTALAGVAVGWALARRPRH
ncbi:carbon monoxide dehydrogenase subunit G [Nonomuraea sp. NPDC050328]|uniref:carbon monoxide dehydrogenase subunit G n=1 Tax=Nonomuraea sp. NPDC050328 TaxID=3364361 RepID=UPI0037B6AE1D